MTVYEKWTRVRADVTRERSYDTSPESARLQSLSYRRWRGISKHIRKITGTGVIISLRYLFVTPATSQAIRPKIASTLKTAQVEVANTKRGRRPQEVAYNNKKKPRVTQIMISQDQWYGLKKK